jgi:predicted nucleic acid-binding protein
VPISRTPTGSCGRSDDRSARRAGKGGRVAKFLLDSDVVIAWLHHDEDVVAWLKERDAAGDVLGWTPVSIAEIGAGLRPREAFVMSDLTRVLHCVELDERVGRKAGAYRLHFGGSHGVEIADALIAAAAHVHGLTLCTRNLRHYPMRDIKKRRV